MTFSLHQYAYVSGTTEYKYGHNSIPQVETAGAPDDANYARSAMLYGDNKYRYYCFKGSSTDTIYQFAWNGRAYEYGYGGAIPELKITGLPDDACPSKFAMLHDGGAYRLYVQKLGHPVLYQCAWNGSSYAYGHNSIPEIKITDFPADADLNRWDMLHDGSDYRLYCMSFTNPTCVYQGAFSGGSYAFGAKSIPKLTLTNSPDSVSYSEICMLYDGSTYRMYIV
eukprot:TRINITY_DN17611_c0_g1_i1.p1 TRINITY_DN17611_c0_g1~~TRINITY_DN17611_c0_g1_i1.p1  ORF type:complete len:224 (-),score=16.63 TRINITY_DN17611_c0_g1_i1:198-869(-)